MTEKKEKEGQYQRVDDFVRRWRYKTVMLDLNSSVLDELVNS